MKTCSKCNEVKELHEFYKWSKGKDGLQNQCKSCMKKYNASYHHKNARDIRERKKEYHKENRERILKRMKEYNLANRDKHNQYSKEHRKRESSKYAGYASSYRARKKNAIPAWSNNGCVLMFYRERDWISKVTNLEYHVDHIVPLFGNDVCGLHVETNLRIIPAVENLVKSNKLPEEL